MSALAVAIGGKADIGLCSAHVRLSPKADMTGAAGLDHCPIGCGPTDFFFVLIPSMIAMAWFVWRASGAELDSQRSALDHIVHERGSQSEFDGSERRVL